VIPTGTAKSPQSHHQPTLTACALVGSRRGTQINRSGSLVVILRTQSCGSRHILKDVDLAKDRITGARGEA